MIQVLMMVKTESEADLAFLDKLIERNPEYTKRDLSTGKSSLQPSTQTARNA